VAGAGDRPDNGGRGGRRYVLMQQALLLVALTSLGCFDPTVNNGGFACDPSAMPPCPVGYSCVNKRCINGVPVVHIDKTGPAWAGQHTDPGLATTGDCPDESLEPNDGPAPPAGQPIVVSLVPDTVTARLTKMAICPKGPNPPALTKRHDSDWYRVEVPATVKTIMAELFYDIVYGDIDVGIVDASGVLLAADGTAQSNACVTASVSAGVYYVVAVGAYDLDVNNYDIRVRAFTHDTACMSNVDMATATSD
jgi:hypothetical protein